MFHFWTAESLGGVHGKNIGKVQDTKGQKCTRFKVVYGRAPPSVARFIPEEILVEAVAPCLVERNEALKQLKYQLRDH